MYKLVVQIAILWVL